MHRSQAGRQTPVLEESLSRVDCHHLGAESGLMNKTCHDELGRIDVRASAGVAGGVNAWACDCVHAGSGSVGLSGAAYEGD